MSQKDLKQDWIAVIAALHLAVPMPLKQSFSCVQGLARDPATVGTVAVYIGKVVSLNS